MTVGIYELEPFLNADVNTFKACYSPAISASVTGVGVDRTQPQRRCRTGRGRPRHRDGDRHGARRERQGLRRPQRRVGPARHLRSHGGRIEPARGDLHQLGPVRGAAVVGLPRRRGVALRAGRGPGPDRGGGVGGRRVRGLLRLPELPRHPLGGRRPGEPTLGHERGGDHHRRPRPGAGRDGVERRVVRGVGRGRDLDALDHAGVAAGTRGAERLYQGAGLLHGCGALSGELGGGNARRVARSPTSAPTPIRTPGTPSSARV